jgi:FixJ family two-component response regulator
MNYNETSVCVIDDDASVREAVEGLLRSAGLRVETFVSAQEFPGRPDQGPPGCLLLDVEAAGAIRIGFTE